MENQADQWKQGGECRICRKRKYCRTECRAAREHLMAKAVQIVEKRTGLGTLMNAIGQMDPEGRA